MESQLEDEVIDAVIEKAEEEDTFKFWSKNEKGTIKVIPILFKKYLETADFISIVQGWKELCVC